jgi:FtsH-binding integral membrane protein
MSTSKLHQPEDDIPYAQVLPLKPEDPPTAYAVNYKPYHDDIESQTKPSEPIASVVGEATVLENLGWDPKTRKMFIRKVYSILTVQLLLTGGVSAFMTLHLPTQMYVLSHGWPVILSMVLSFGLLFACMLYKVCAVFVL